MLRFNAISHSTCATHTLSKNSNHIFFLVKYDMKLISYIYTQNLSQFNAILQPKVVFQKLKHVIPYLKANSIFKKFSVSHCFILLVNPCTLDAVKNKTAKGILTNYLIEERTFLQLFL